MIYSSIQNTQVLPRSSPRRQPSCTNSFNSSSKISLFNFPFIVRSCILSFTRRTLIDFPSSSCTCEAAILGRIHALKYALSSSSSVTCSSKTIIISLIKTCILYMSFTLRTTKYKQIYTCISYIYKGLRISSNGDLL